jgi:hypothetical protein
MEAALSSHQSPVDRATVPLFRYRQCPIRLQRTRTSSKTYRTVHSDWIPSIDSLGRTSSNALSRLPMTAARDWNMGTDRANPVKWTFHDQLLCYYV